MLARSAAVTPTAPTASGASMGRFGKAIALFASTYAVLFILVGSFIIGASNLVVSCAIITASTWRKWLRKA